MASKRVSKFFSCLLTLNFCLLLLILSGCSSTTCAPVVDAWHDPNAIKSRYRVQKDDTLYSVAWAFDLDYRDLVKTNHLAPPYKLKPGQTLSMQIKNEAIDKEPTSYAITEYSSQVKPFQEIVPKASKKTSQLAVSKQDASSKMQKEVASLANELELPELELTSIGYRAPSNKNLQPIQDKNNLFIMKRKTVGFNQDKIFTQIKAGHWQWPARGKIVRNFSLQTGGSKGLEISGKLDDPIRSTAPGKVVYSGSGLRGYGNLVIIKHSDNYLSAYAYNKKLLVKEGDVVEAGTEIGKMGQNDSGHVLLHFEIRRHGKPVDPLLYL